MDAVWIRVIAAAVIAYFCGCFNGAVIVSKYILRDDVRTHGSGNAGLTNFYRTFGGPLTFVVILTDVLKAVVALLIGRWLLVGHLPALAIDWRVALVGWGGFILLFLLTRYVSLGSSSTGIDLPIVTWFVYRDWVLLVLICIMGGLILWKHRSNIARLISGTESKFSFHRKAAG